VASPAPDDPGHSTELETARSPGPQLGPLTPTEDPSDSEPGPATDAEPESDPKPALGPCGPRAKPLRRIPAADAQARPHAGSPLASSSDSPGACAHRDLRLALALALSLREAGASTLKLTTRPRGPPPRRALTFEAHLLFKP
jgi:hypothetical protein